MESPTCPICRTSEFVVVTKGVGKHPMHEIKCKKCKLMVTHGSLGKAHFIWKSKGSGGKGGKVNT